MSINGVFSGISEYNGLITEIAKQEQTQLVDTANLLPHSATFFTDRVHFTEAGAEKMAQSFYPVVDAALKKKGLVK